MDIHVLDVSGIFSADDLRDTYATLRNEGATAAEAQHVLRHTYGATVRQARAATKGYVPSPVPDLTPEQVAAIEADTAAYAVRLAARHALESVFAAEYDALSPGEQAAVLRDVTTDGGIDDYAEYRRRIGSGNLRAYAAVLLAQK